MSLTNYTELLAAIADYAARDDLTSRIPDFVLASEAIFNFGEEGIDPLRVREMRTTSALTVTDGLAVLPADFLETIRFGAAARQPLPYVSERWYAQAFPSGDSVEPIFYSVGSDIQVGTDGTLVYYAKIPDLATNSTNWLLTKSPFIYLYGGLYNLYLFTQAPEKATGYRNMMMSQMNGLRDTNKWSAAGGYERRASAVAF